MNLKIDLNSAKKLRWQVVFEEGNWLCGIYQPENKSLADVSKLEKHDAPELFLLVRGEITMVISKDGKNLEEYRLKPGEVFITNQWHNAYSEGGGRAMVIEKCGVKTEFIYI